jgi:hypothetical protein
MSRDGIFRRREEPGPGTNRCVSICGFGPSLLHPFPNGRKGWSHGGGIPSIFLKRPEPRSAMTGPPQQHTPKKQRGRARRTAPYVSLKPWTGFTGHESPREMPLPICPSARCRRVKQSVFDEDDLSARMERIAALAEIQRAHDRAMFSQWQTGGFDHVFGPYRRSGVVLKPPPRAYVELPAGKTKTGVDKAERATYRPRRRPRFRGRTSLGTGD